MAVDRKKIVGYGVLWALIIVVVIWANNVAMEHRSKQPITKFEIIVDGGAESLIDAELIDGWLVLNEMHPEGKMVADVDLAKLESIIAEHSAVKSANAYVTYDGHLVVNVSQRRAVARLRVGDYDMYLCEDGYVLPVTDCHTLLLPVITGDYVPLFEKGFVGLHEDSANEPLRAIDERIRGIEQRRVDLLKEREVINGELRKVEKRGVKREVFMSDNEYRGRVEHLKEEKVEARRIHAEKDRDIELALRELDAERLNESLEAERIRACVADFGRLIEFALYLCDDPFWRAEIVQIELTGGGDDPMQIAVVPRSGDFVVDLGFTDDLVDKLGTLRYFYDEALSNIGWDEYEHISLRYDDQVVCK